MGKVCVIIVVILVALAIFYYYNHHSNRRIEPFTNINNNSTSCVDNKLPPGPWITSCKNHILTNGGTSLYAQCKNDNGVYQNTSIELNTCRDANCILVNNNGMLQCANSTSNDTPDSSRTTCNGLSGEWKDVCFQSRYTNDGKTVQAICPTNDGMYRSTSLDIDQCWAKGCSAYVDDGYLRCGEYQGSPPVPAPSPSPSPSHSPVPADTCTWPSGSWTNSCKDYFYNSNTGTIDALCQDNSGNYVPSNIDVSNCSGNVCYVRNNNGVLECDQ